MRYLLLCAHVRIVDADVLLHPLGFSYSWPCYVFSLCVDTGEHSDLRRLPLLALGREPAAVDPLNRQVGVS